MDKVIFEVKRPRSLQQEVIRVDGNAYDAICRLQALTNYSVKHIASKLICFAAEHVEILEVE